MNEGPRPTAAQRAEIEAWETTPLGPEEFEARAVDVARAGGLR
jgi:hypothetical protein